MLSYFKIKEQSMEPTFQAGDFVLVNKMSYLFSKPRVGHIVVVKHPKNPSMLLLKRVVQEKEGMYWIEGDNTSKSTDSRHFGWIRNKYIVGKAYIAKKPRTRSLVRDCAR